MKTSFFASRTYFALVLIVLAAGPMNVISRGLSSGPPAGFSGAPLEIDCSACHLTYPLNSGTATFAVSTSLTFVPGSTNALAVTFSGSSNPQHGFQVTARDGNDNAVGTWQTVMTGMTKDAAGSQAHHEQTSSGALLSGWTMNWIAPATLPNGPVTFYAAGVQGSGGSGPDDDYVYTTSTKLYQATLSTPAAGWPIGTTQPLALSAPTHPGELYFIVPATDPTPLPLGGPFVLEVTIDWSFLNFALATPQVFQNIAGNLGASGQASASVAIPFHPPLIGFPLHFAAATATLTPMLTPTEVSNRVSVTLQ